MAARKNKNKSPALTKPGKQYLLLWCPQDSPSGNRNTSSRPRMPWFDFSIWSCFCRSGTSPFSRSSPSPLTQQSASYIQICGQVTCLLSLALLPSLPFCLPSCFFNGWTDQETDKSQVTAHLGTGWYSLTQNAEGPSCLQATSEQICRTESSNHLII